MKIRTPILFAAIAPLLMNVANADPSANPKEVTAVSGVKEGTGAAWRASEVIGTDVKNAGDEKIGKVEDLLVDLKAGEILAVVVSTGGFLGAGDTLSSIPASALRYDLDAKAFKTKLTKEQLGQAPQYKGDKEEDHESYGNKLRAYRDSIGGDVTAADNSANNEKDMDGKKLTPVDQGNSESDLNLTKDIRMSVVNADLSFNAKNVKIITRDGKITLRGVVDSEAEKDAIVDIAKKHGGSAPVTNELEVK